MEVSGETVESVVDRVECEESDAKSAVKGLDIPLEELSLVPIYDSSSMYTVNISHAFQNQRPHS